MICTMLDPAVRRTVARQRALYRKMRHAKLLAIQGVRKYDWIHTDVARTFKRARKAA